MNLLNEPVLQDHCDKVQKRFDFVIKPCLLIAYMFHPKYLGAGMTLEQIETVKEWLICKDEAFLPATVAFQAEATPFPTSFFATRGQASNPMTRWKAFGSSTGLPDGSSTSWWRYSLQWHHLQLWSKSSVALGWYSPSSAINSGSRKLQSWCSSTGY